MQEIQELFDSIESGKAGHNIGLDTGLSKLNNIIYGVQKRSLIVIGASTGGGKTTGAMFSYVKRALDQMLDSGKLKIIYYSFELSRIVLYAKLLSLHIYDMDKKVIPYKTILSLDKVITEEEYAYVVKYREWLNKVSTVMTIYDKQMNAKMIAETQKKTYESLGRFINASGSIKYIYNDPEQYIISVIDHIGLIALSKGNTLKDEIDNVVKVFIEYRNICGGTYVIVQQLNRTSSTMDRRKFDMQEILLSDFKDSGGTTEGADVVLGLYYPHRDKLVNYRKYRIGDTTECGVVKPGLGNSYRFIQVLKNRFGESDVGFSVGFYGKVGYMHELPNAEDFTDADYELYHTLVDDIDLNKLNKHAEQFEGLEPSAAFEKAAGVSNELVPNFEFIIN